MRSRGRITALILNLTAIILSLIFIIPMVVIFINSFKSPAESNTMSMRLPTEWMFENYSVVVERGKVFASFLNSFCYAACSAILIVVLVAMAAFVLSRNRSGINRFIYYFIILGIAMPVSNVPLMKVMKALHIINTRPGIILLYAAINIPISLFIVYGFVASIHKEIDEAAIIDGATLLQRIRYVDLPAIVPTAVIMLILEIGRMLNMGYEKILAMQNQNNLSVSEVIPTYAFKVSLVSSFPDYSYATAIGLFQSMVGLILILLSNKIAKKLTGDGFI